MAILFARPRLQNQIVEIRNKRKHGAVRRSMLWLHSIIGILASAYILVMSLSGTALVFHDELADIFSPPARINAANKEREFSKAIKAVHEKYPERSTSWIRNSPDRSRASELWLDMSGQPKLTMQFNPYTGELLGLKQNSALLDWVESLHFNLLMEDNGRTVNGIGAILLLLLAATGTIVWWRGLRLQWHHLRRNFSIQAPPQSKAFIWELHSVVGIWTLGFLLIWGVSGLFFCFPNQFRSAVGIVLPLTKSITDEQSQSSSQGTVRLDRTISAVLQKYPAYTPIWIGLPGSKATTIKLFVLPPGGTLLDQSVAVEADGTTGQILTAKDPNSKKSGDQFLKWLVRLHFGNFAGLFAKSIWVCLGITPGLLAVTGAILWWRREQRKKRQKLTNQAHLAGVE